MGKRRFNLRDVEIDDSRLNVAMSEELLDGVEIDSIFEQVSGERMAKGMHGDILFDFSFCHGLVDNVLDASFAHGFSGGEAFEEIDFGFLVREVVRELAGDKRREHDVPVFLSFTLPDVNLFSIRVNVGDLDQAQFIHSESGAVGEGEQESMFECAWRFEECLTFLFRKDLGKCIRLLDGWHAQGLLWDVEHFEPIAQTVDSLFEVTFRAFLMDAESVEIRVKFFSGDVVRGAVELEGHLRDTTAIVFDEAFAVLRERCFFNELVVMDFKFRHDVTGLLHEGVEIFLLEAHKVLI